MQDIYAEQIVKKENKTLPRLLFLLCSVMVLINFAMSLINPLAGIFALIFLVTAWYMRRYQEIEYEYELTNSVLDLDVIYNQEKRKNVASIDISKGKAYKRKNDIEDLHSMKVHNFASDIRSEDNLWVVVSKASKKECYVIKPDEEMRDGIRRFISVYKA